MSNKKNPLRNIFLSCGKAKLQDVFEPTPKPKISTNDQKPSARNSRTLQSHFSSSSWEKDGMGGGGDEDHTSTTTTFSFNNMNMSSAAATSSQYSCSDHQLDDQSISNRLMMSPSPKICHSVAVVKDSDDPYLDFKESMLQMIMERNIYSKEDLQELLRCFVQLNSSAHHDVIVRAFVEICNGVFSATAGDCST